MGKGKPRADAPPSDVERLEQATAQAREVLIQITQSIKTLRATEKEITESIDERIVDYIKTQMDQELENLATGIKRNIEWASTRAISVFRSNLVSLIKLIQMTKREFRTELIRRTSDMVIPPDVVVGVIETLVEATDQERELLLAKIDMLDVSMNRRGVTPHQDGR